MLHRPSGSTHASFKKSKEQKPIPIMEPIDDAWHVLDQERPIDMHRVARQHSGLLDRHPFLDVLQHGLLHERVRVLRCQASLCQTGLEKGGGVKGFVNLTVVRDAQRHAVSDTTPPSYKYAQRLSRRRKATQTRTHPRPPSPSRSRSQSHHRLIPGWHW